jgi:hypothetical protein
MAFAHNLTGLRFGRLTALHRAPNNAKDRVMWRCRCDCGNEIVTAAMSLRTCDTKSCGCLHDEKIGLASRSHGRSKTQLYAIWKAMKGRCYIASNTSYDRYGARGVRVCDRWRNSFEAFLQDIGEPPVPDMSLERINNSGDYEPGNVRWATRIEQGANKRNNLHIDYSGKRQTVAQWARERGIKYSTLRQRVVIGWSPERAWGIR